MFLDVKTYDEGIVFNGVRDFDLRHTFDCGQCFRWKEDTDGSYIGVASSRVVRFIKRDDVIYIKGGVKADIDFWIHYLDMNRDYGLIKKELSNDEILKEAIAHGGGIRILNQEMFEIIVSFIISANNRIPMIKRAVENISKAYGSKIVFEDKEYYSFPTPQQLMNADEESLSKCGCGFRGKYIIKTTSEIARGNVDLNEIKSMTSNMAHNELIKFNGVGPKVADCILLFSMEKTDAFPVDVWVKRVMQYFYLAPDISLKKIRDFGRNKFGDYAGIAQEYLFYYARDLKGKEGLEK